MQKAINLVLTTCLCAVFGHLTLAVVESAIGLYLEFLRLVARNQVGGNILRSASKKGCTNNFLDSNVEFAC